MNWVSNDLVSTLWFLLPGFIAAWVFSEFTAFAKGSEFDRLVQALIFTAFSQLATLITQYSLLGLGSLGLNMGSWNSDIARGWSVVLGSLLGLCSAAASNRELAHRLFRRAGVTLQTGYPSEWFGVFQAHGRAYVVLHLVDGRRLQGWPEEWPSDPLGGHFSLSEPTWLDVPQTPRPLTTERMLVPSREVSIVEFLRSTDSRSSGKD